MADSPDTSWIQLWQATAQSLQVVAIVIVGIFAWRVGRKQNSIAQNQADISKRQAETSKRLLDLEEYVSVAVQGISNNAGIPLVDSMCIKNFSAQPIELLKYSINGAVYERRSLIPQNGWLNFAIPDYLCVPGPASQATVKILYDDYRGHRYLSTNYISFSADGWTARTERNVTVEQNYNI